MQEKEMVNDALSSINSGLTSYASMIAQTENQELRSTLKQMRDQAEKSQYDLYTIAKNLGYYTPAQQASQDEIMKVKSEVCSNSTQSSGSSSQGMTSSNSSSSSSQGMSSSNSSSSSSQGMSSSNSSSSGMSFSNSSSKGLSKDIEIDPQKKKDLQAPPKTQTNSFQ